MMIDIALCVTTTLSKRKKDRDRDRDNDDEDEDERQTHALDRGKRTTSMRYTMQSCNISINISSYTSRNNTHTHTQYRLRCIHAAQTEELSPSRTQQLAGPPKKGS